MTKYLKSQASSSYIKVSSIEKASTEREYATRNSEIGKELLQAFFSTSILCEQKEENPAIYEQLYSELIAKHEVKAAVFKANSDKASSRDNLSVQV